MRAMPTKISLSSTKKSIPSPIPRTIKNRQYQCVRGACLIGANNGGFPSCDRTRQAPRRCRCRWDTRPVRGGRQMNRFWYTLSG
jgi:hypothetical protein